MRMKKTLMNENCERMARMNSRVNIFRVVCSVISTYSVSPLNFTVFYVIGNFSTLLQPFPFLDFPLCRFLTRSVSPSRACYNAHPPPQGQPLPIGRQAEPTVSTVAGELP